MKTIYWVILVLILVCILVWCFFFRNDGSDLVSVNCDKPGVTLANTIKNNPGSRVFEVSGECKEEGPIVLSRNNNGIKITGVKNGIRNTLIRPQDALFGEISLFKIVGTKNVSVSNVTIADARFGMEISKRAYVEVTGSTFKENRLAGICAVGEAKPETEDQSKQFSMKEITEDCNVPPIPPEDTPIYKNNSLSLSSIRSALISDATAQQIEDTTVNICNSDFTENSGSGLIAIRSSANSHPTDGGSCSLNFSDNADHGYFGVGGSTLNTQYTTLELKNNGKGNNVPTGVGLGVLGSSSIILDNSSITGSENDLGIYVDQSSSITCSASTISVETSFIGGTNNGCDL